MPEDPFEKARREMERARRDFHERIERAQEELRRTMDAGRSRIADARAAVEERMDAARRGTKPPGKKKPRGRFGGGGNPLEPKPGGPLPSPVKPDNPSLLSGGAEAPLDE